MTVGGGGTRRNSKGIFTENCQTTANSSLCHRMWRGKKQCHSIVSVHKYVTEITWEICRVGRWMATYTDTYTHTNISVVNLRVVSSLNHWKITKESMQNNGCLNMNAAHKHCPRYDVAQKVLQNNIMLVAVHYTILSTCQQDNYMDVLHISDS